MVYTHRYDSPVGKILLAADEIGMIGLWFEGQKYFASNLPADYCEQKNDILIEAVRWLDIYFGGKKPDFTLPLHPVGTKFRQSVWEILLEIPYGKTITYGEIVKNISATRGLSSMSAQAVGGAVGHNPISIIIPCHRVVGVDGHLKGYAGGIERKRYLLELEQNSCNANHVQV